MIYVTSFLLLFCPPSGSAQSKQILFSPSTEPTFINVPQNSFVEPFVLNPGMWTVVIEAKGILLVGDGGGHSGGALSGITPHAHMPHRHLCV